MKRLTIGAKLTFICLLSMVTLLTIAVFVISGHVRSVTEQQAMEIGHATGEIVAREVLIDIEHTYQAGQTLASAVEIGHRNGTLSRETLSEFIEATVLSSHNLMGAWIGMEPGGMGDWDENYIGSYHSDPISGQFSFYVNRGGPGGSITSRPMKIANMDYDDPINFWYSDALRSGTPNYTEPTVYPDIGGKEAMLVSISLPVHLGDTIVGVAGTDVEMLAVSKKLSALKPLDTGNVFLISNRGNWIGFSDSTALGQPIEQALPDLAAHRDRILGGEFQSVYRFSPTLGVDVVTLFVPIPLPGTDLAWSVMINLPMATIGATTQETLILILAVFTMLVIGLCLTLLISVRMLVKNPLAQLLRAIERLRDQDYETPITGQERTDETGRISRCLERFREDLKRINALEAAQIETERKASRDRAQARNQMADSLETSVGGVVTVVRDSATEMEQTAKEMAALAQRSMDQATDVADAATAANGNVATVASASEQLSASITEIGSQVQKSAEIANRAVDQSNEANGKIRHLLDAAERIGEVVTLITDIADQTNLLALNATIEAARAGDAGKGFAVVAHEVKSLANQTSKATEDIAHQIAAIQTETKQSVGAIELISQTITNINATAATIAAAVEQQGAATREIARSVQEAATGTLHVSENIVHMRSASETVLSSAAGLEDASAVLAKEANGLSDDVTGFLEKIRA